MNNSRTGSPHIINNVHTPVMFVHGSCPVPPELGALVDDPFLVIFSPAERTALLTGETLKRPETGQVKHMGT